MLVFIDIVVYVAFFVVGRKCDECVSKNVIKKVFDCKVNIRVRQRRNYLCRTRTTYKFFSWANEVDEACRRRGLRRVLRRALPRVR